MGMSFSDEFSFISAGASSIQEEDPMFFYSVPTSPSFKFKTSSLYGSELDGDEFQFETSRRFLDSHDFDTDQRKEDKDEEEEEEEEEERKTGDSLPTMAFADELFCDGKVLALPLKLPPKIQNGSGRKTSTPSSMASLSPRLLRSSVRRTFSGKSVWNDDFDPFMVALKVVREEENRGKPKARDGIRRTKSELLIRRTGPNCGPCEGPNEPFMSASRRPEMVLSEPKGLMYAKNGPNRSKEEIETDGDWEKKRKREKITKFLLGKASGQYKLRDQKDEIVSKGKKMTVTCYKPRFLL